MNQINPRLFNMLNEQPHARTGYADTFAKKEKRKLVELLDGVEIDIREYKALEEIKAITTAHLDMNTKLRG